MTSLIILGLSLATVTCWYLYFKYSREYDKCVGELKTHNETVREFLTEAHDKKYQYDLTNPVHKKLNSIPYEERLKTYLPLRERDKYLHEEKFVNNRCTVEVFINRGIPSHSIKSELEKIHEVLMDEYHKLNKNDGTNWRLSPKWIKEHLNNTIDEFYLK